MLKNFIAWKPLLSHVRLLRALKSFFRKVYTHFFFITLMLPWKPFLGMYLSVFWCLFSTS